MKKEELKKLQARNRELQANLRSLYMTAEKEKRELNEQELAQEREWSAEIQENHREILLSNDDAAIAKLREEIDRNKQYREYLQGVRQKREDATITLAPKSPADGSSITESGAINLYIQDILDTRENGLGRPQGQSFVTGVEGDELYPYSINDVEMEEVGEVEAINDQALDFTNLKVQSRRVSLSVGISNKAIDNAAFDLVSFVLYKIDKAWRIYFAKKNYSHAAWTGNKGAFSQVTPETITFGNNIGAIIDEKFGEIAEEGFDDLGVVVLSPRMEAKLKHTFEGNGVAAHAIIENGLCCGHPYVATKHVNYKLNGNKYVKDTDEYIGIGLFQYLPIQQHGLVRQTVDATSAAVAKANKTVVCFSTEISITELSHLINGGNEAGKPKAFKLLKVQFPASSAEIGG